uniref:Uncharacterized protein n=1 Tax=Globodera rostochiensis TaxID=31243 RepID=A0A914I3K6_GLORO
MAEWLCSRFAPSRFGSLPRGGPLKLNPLRRGACLAVHAINVPLWSTPWRGPSCEGAFSRHSSLARGTAADGYVARLVTWCGVRRLHRKSWHGIPHLLLRPEQAMFFGLGPAKSVTGPRPQKAEEEANVPSLIKGCLGIPISEIFEVEGAHP